MASPAKKEVREATGGSMSMVPKPVKPLNTTPKKGKAAAVPVTKGKPKAGKK